MKVTYQVTTTREVDPELLRDIDTRGKDWAVIRTSPISEQAWSFHPSRKAAEAAVRRWRSRDIVTR